MSISEPELVHRAARTSRRLASENPVCHRHFDEALAPIDRVAFSRRLILQR